MKSWVLFAAALALLFGAAGVFVSLALRGFGGPVAEAVPGESLYREVMGRVVRDHMDPIDGERVVYGAMKGIASELDPHSRVFDPAEWAEFQRETRGEDTGLGIRIASLEEGLFVGWVAPEGPADRAGIKVGDRIVGITGGPEESDRPALLRALRGDPGSRLDLVVAARDGSARRHVHVTRGPFDVATVHSRVLPGPRVLYARVTAFRPQTMKAFERAIGEASLKDLKGMILDLRFNRGGAFDSAVAMADAWLSGGVIVTTRGPSRIDEKHATAEAPLGSVPTVVLVNGYTASAAEVVAGALQDTHAALLVGERTFGKGVVQEIIEFETWGGGMKLTTARYFTPSGRCIDRSAAGGRDAVSRRGLLPDVVVEVPAADEPALERALDRDAYPDWLKTALAERDPAAAEGDPQLAVALAVLAGSEHDRPVSDGAGDPPGRGR